MALVSPDEEVEDSPEPELSTEEKLLNYSRNGNLILLKQLLINGAIESDLINCKGQKKANRDWTPLHLASYFGHDSVVSLLLSNGADIDSINDKGDTPLHKAAYTGRLDVVTTLLKNNADVNIVNSEGKTPLHVSKGDHVQKLIKAAQQTETSRLQHKFLHFASDGDLEALEQMMKDRKQLNVNCVDSHGNTALHLAAYRDRQQVAAFLMQAGVKSDIRNMQGQQAADVATSAGMKLVLSLTPLGDLRKTVTRHEGYLYKKTRLLGFQRRYVVLDKGVLTVFSSLADASSGVRRRTFKYLDDAQCLVQSRDNLGIAVVFNNGSTYIFRVEPAGDATESVSRQKWVNALRNHIAYSTYYTHKGLGDSEEFEDLLPLNSITEAIETAQAHQTMLEKEVKSLVTLTDSLSVNSLGFTSSSSPVHLQQKVKSGIQEAVTRSAVIATTSRDMCNVLQHCMTLLTQQEQLRSQQLDQEKERCRVLQESLRVLAVQNHELEQQFECSGGYHSPIDMVSSSDEEEFFDCDLQERLSLKNLVLGESDERTLWGTPDELDVTDKESSLELLSAHKPVLHTDMSKIRRIRKPAVTGRTELPAPMLSRNEFSVWSILKQCIGKELSKITMPVVFNEPISFLQRITEYMEYSYLLDRADACETPEERMAYVAAFAVSASSSNWDRLGKPFNPLLGETYELEKKELNYKVVCEQVSHHPPVSAFHVLSESYKVYGAINPKLKFWGKSVEITPQGMVTVELTRHEETYTWENVNCAVHNIIVGKLWVEHHGKMEILNHKTGHKADITFKKSSMFNKEAHKVEGSILDKRNNKLLMLYGSWTDALFSIEPTIWDNFLKQDKPKTSKNGLFEKDMLKSLGKSLSKDDQEEEVPQRASNFDLRIPGQTLLWQADARPDNSDKYYSFTKFAMMLNELGDDDEMRNSLCPTDSRLRPDIRSLEMGNIDEAAEKKVHLEEKQRTTRKNMKKNKEEWETRWFDWGKHPISGKSDWVFNDKYWNRDFSSAPDIF